MREIQPTRYMSRRAGGFKRRRARGSPWSSAAWSTISKGMSDTSTNQPSAATATPQPARPAEGTPPPAAVKPPPGEIGGPKGLEPTRFGDWERNGRCVDF